MLTCTKNVRHSLPPIKFINNRCPNFSPTPPPKINPAQIFIFLIYKIFHKIYIFCCKCGLLDKKYFLGYLQYLDMVCLSIQKQNNHTSLISIVCVYKSYHNEKKSLLMKELMNYILPQYLYDTVHTKI